MRTRLLAAALGCGLLVGWLWPVSGPHADSTPTAVGRASVPIFVAPTKIVGPREAKRPSRDRDRGLACRDDLARLLHKAGFRGESLRTAWAIAMRESGGQNLDESSRWYTGGLGIFQVQTSAHAGKAWWSRSAMLDPARQARLVYLHLSDRGTDWRHWGMGSGPTVDTTFYGGWSASQVEAWIAEPFFRYWRAWPCDGP